MAFNIDDFDRLSQAGVSGIPTMWGYRSTTDALAAIAASSYFNDIAARLDIGDYIYVRGSDGSSAYSVTAVSPNVTCAVAFA